MCRQQVRCGVPVDQEHEADSDEPDQRQRSRRAACRRPRHPVGSVCGRMPTVIARSSAVRAHPAPERTRARRLSRRALVAMRLTAYCGQLASMAWSTVSVFGPWR